MTNPEKKLSDKEIAKRRDAVLKQMLKSPPKPHDEMKVGKGKRDKKPGEKRRSA